LSITSSDQKNRPSRTQFDFLKLRHGQALWLLRELGLGKDTPYDTFNYYIKSLRKLGIPFKRGEPGLRGNHLAEYSFYDLMELGIILGLRVYGILPDVVARSLISFRNDLRIYYHRAFVERDCGLGTPIFVSAAGGTNEPGFLMSGVYLDLRLTYAAGQLTSVGPPELLGPFEALAKFAEAASPARPHTPLNLSKTAARIIDLMNHAPPLRSGPKSRPHRWAAMSANG
jgi:hypothetical protein